MDQQSLYSIRMHASRGGRHISGAERIAPAEQIDAVVRDLVNRARGRHASPEQISITIDALEGMSLRQLISLDVMTVHAPDKDISRVIAAEVLQDAGVASTAVEAAMHYISNGASSSGGVMRGAMVIDSSTGERLEPDRERGVRVSRFDWTDEALQRVQQVLGAAGLTHHRTREALALATKVAHAPGVIAELCWSDDPDYTAGYVASLRSGYVRFPFLKQRCDARGGRAFFVDRKTLDPDSLDHYLQYDPVLISDVGTCRTVLSLEDVLSHSIKESR